MRYDTLNKKTFQSTPLTRGETRRIGRIHRADDISIHSPHTRGDSPHLGFRRGREHFNPLPSYEGRLDIPLVGGQIQVISIHSPHSRGDGQQWVCDEVDLISIHSPHARGDALAAEIAAYTEKFQSTPLMRGETYRTLYRALGMEVFQSAPLIRGETLSAVKVKDGKLISIHSPHTRGDYSKV